MPASWSGLFVINEADTQWTDLADQNRAIFLIPRQDPSTNSLDQLWDVEGLTGGSVVCRTWIGGPLQPVVGWTVWDLNQQWFAETADAPGTVYQSPIDHVSPYGKYVGPDRVLWPLRMREDLEGVDALPCTWRSYEIEAAQRQQNFPPRAALANEQWQWTFTEDYSGNLETNGWFFNGFRFEYQWRISIPNPPVSAWENDPRFPPDFQCLQLLYEGRHFYPVVAGLPGSLHTYSWLTSGGQYLDQFAGAANDQCPNPTKQMDDLSGFPSNAGTNLALSTSTV